MKNRQKLTTHRLARMEEKAAATLLALLSAKVSASVRASASRELLKFCADKRGAVKMSGLMADMCLDELNQTSDDVFGRAMEGKQFEDIDALIDELVDQKMCGHQGASQMESEGKEGSISA